MSASIAARIAWSSGQLSSAEFKVLVALASCGDYDTGRNCYPRWKTLVARSSLSRATVARTLVKLKNPRRPGGPWIVVTARAHRHSTTYDVRLDRLATHPPKEQQVSLDALLVAPEFESHIETQPGSESHDETQEPEFESQIETPTCDPDLVPEERTHTPRAREPELPLLGQLAPSKCAHPYRHAWCDGRIHVPRDLHFEFLDRLGALPGETRAEKAGRLIAFYAADQAQLPPETDVPNPFKYWNDAFNAWLAQPASRRLSRRAIAEAETILHRIGYCPHDPAHDDWDECIATIARKVG